MNKIKSFLMEFTHSIECLELFIVPRGKCKNLKDRWKDPYVVCLRHDLEWDKEVVEIVKSLSEVDYQEQSEKSGSVAYIFRKEYNGVDYYIKIEALADGSPKCWSFHEWIDGYDPNYEFYGRDLDALYGR